MAGEIRKVSGLLRKPKKVKQLDELREKRKRLQDEMGLLESKLGEFRSAIRCILACLGDECDKGEEEEGEVAVFDLGKEMEWSRLHCLMVRECRRLDDGLPIYAYRREILKCIGANQVMVLVGETGSGKSTQLVQFLADSGVASGSIICTQPRKVAAISLAQRVREESEGCYTDNFVMSHLASSNSQIFGSGVIYMTDHYLLQHCISNTSFRGISYIVVDEAHERSLNTDLLLALIKKTLLLRCDLRLIIMSATADASKLSEYFYGCCTFYVMGRTFPVEIKYVPDVSAETSWTTLSKVSTGNCASYVSDIIRMVCMIHKKEGDGAILAFLTSQMEVEWACECFSDPTAVVLPMHGKLSYEEQSRVFQSYPGKRKVIFSTNVAETSLTIRGVKYVVDSGMAKDCRFEPSTGMNVLKVERISQSSANQRAGRAGRTESGKCYRLYAESEFQSMNMHQEPEIRKVHLGIAVLRILALGIKSVQDFEFVDAPDQSSIETAIHNLVQLGAVIFKNEVCELTKTGKMFVRLGIEPRLGKIVLDCYSFGLGKEGVVLAAVMTNSSSIFCRVGTDEDKSKADCLRLPFCHRDGDLFTLLSVYKEWEEKHGIQNKWCWQNSINAKSLRRCQETVMELESTLRHELNIIIPSYWLWSPHEPSVHDKSLKKVILSSLPENVAMFSGCDRLGYEVALTGHHLQLHPSCSLLAYGEKPSWVVFGEILSISNKYLVCVTAVDHECLLSIQPPLFDIPLLESGKVQMNVITAVGNNILRRFCGKLNYNLDTIVSHAREVCMDDRIDIAPNFAKREIQVFAPGQYMEKVTCIVNDALELETKWLKDECVEKCLFHGRPESSTSVALFGAGAEIKHLELDNRYLTVEVSHPNARELNDKELLLIIDQNVPAIGNFCKFQHAGQDAADWYKWGRITFLSPEAAEEATVLLNELEFCGSLLNVLPVKSGDSKNASFPAVRAKVSWPRRPSRGIALINCAAEDANFIVEDCFTLGVGGRYVNIEVSTKKRNCLFVTGLPRDVSEAELYDAMVSMTTRKFKDINLLRGDAVCGPPISTFEDALVREIAPFMSNRQTPNPSFRVEVFNPEPKDYMMKAVITFDGRLHLEAAKALDHLQGKVLPGCLSWQKLQCHHVFHSSVSCPARVYAVIWKQLDSLIESFKHQKDAYCNLEKNNYNGSYRIRITAHATKIVADVRKPLEQLTRGKIVTHPSVTPLIHLLLSRSGVLLMKSVERETGTYILYDRHHLNVKIFGPPPAVDAAEDKLVQSLLSLNENTPLQIHLRGHNLRPDLMKDVVQRFGPHLDGLKNKVPGVELTLNTRQHILLVRGDKEQKKKVEEVISRVALSDAATVTSSPEEAACSICMCELEEPYTLEVCGHRFCRGCLIEQCESVIRSREGLPLRCLESGCQKLIVYADLRVLLSSEKMEELFRASLGAVVSSSGGEYRFCPTPDCPNVYRVVHPEDPEEVGPFVCGACSAETCRKCHVEYHQFVSCERYREYKEDPDLSLLEWRMGKPGEVKDCPVCMHAIEKFDGCNHIACRCGAHICWVCLEVFDGSDPCYNHLRDVHHAIM